VALKKSILFGTKKEKLLVLKTYNLKTLKENRESYQQGIISKTELDDATKNYEASRIDFEVYNREVELDKLAIEKNSRELVYENRLISHGIVEKKRERSLQEKTLLRKKEQRLIEAPSHYFPP